jgi:hypothetical protein
MIGVLAATNTRAVAAALRTALLAALLFCSPTTRAITMPDIPRAPDMRIVVVSDHMVYNGIDMSTYEVSSPHPMDDVLRFYREAWNGKVVESPLTMGLDTSQWTVLAHREGEFMVTVQLRPSKPQGVYGYIAISNIFGGVQHEVGKDVLMPVGSTIVNDIVEDDPGRRSRTVVLKNENSVSFNLDFYRQRLVSEGWTEAADLSTLPGMMGHPQALLMNRGSEEMNLAVTRSGETTTIVMVTVRK